MHVHCHTYRAGVGAEHGDETKREHGSGEGDYLDCVCLTQRFASRWKGGKTKAYRETKAPKFAFLSERAKKEEVEFRLKF